MSFEDHVAAAMFNKQAEKTYIDKVLSKEDVERVRELVKKERLKRSELLELLYMCLSTESKLTNLSEYNRYVMLKYFVWLREFIVVAEIIYDIDEKKEHLQISKQGITLLNNATTYMEHNCKFMIDLYINLMRTTLSLGGSAFYEILKNKFELTYPMPGVQTPIEEKKGLLQSIKNKLS